MTLEEELHHQIYTEIHRRMMVEGMQKLEESLEALTEEEVWERPNANSNSVGNLLLHLCGNITQYIISGIGNQPDVRERQSEFDHSGPIAKASLLNQLEQVMAEANQVMQQLTPANLIEPRKVQGFNETVVGILIHVTEHFTYHLGQIVYVVKAKRNQPMGFYDGMDLDATS